MNKYLSIMVINVLLALCLPGQSKLIVEKKLLVVEADRTAYQLVVLPISLEKKLTKLQVMLDNEKSYDRKTSGFKEFHNNFRLLRVAEYIELAGKRRDKGGFVFGPSVSHREWYPCIELAGKKYVFTEGNIETDTQIFNLVLKEGHLKIESEEEARDLAQLYFTATRGYFENNGKLVLSHVEDVPFSYRKEKEVELKRLQKIVTSPRTKMIDGGYEVELFTWELALGEVIKWNFKIQPDAEVEIQSEVIGKL